MENLEKRLKERLLNGQEQEHDEGLFLEVLALLINHPEYFKMMLSLYMASLSKEGCKDAVEMFNQFLEGKIRLEEEGYGL